MLCDGTQIYLGNINGKEVHLMGSLPVPFVGCFWGYVDCPRAVDVVVGYSRHRRRKHHHLTHASLDLFRKNGSTILKYVFVVVAMGQSRSESE